MHILLIVDSGLGYFRRITLTSCHTTLCHTANQEIRLFTLLKFQIVILYVAVAIKGISFTNPQLSKMQAKDHSI